jgi:GH24 family phage-related lysozyme (muramidase)
MTQQHLVLAAAVIEAEEFLALQAYPDPRSKLGRAMVKRFGSGALLQVGQGKLLIPQDLYRLNGSPWTVGYGETLGVKQGDVWTPARAKEQLLERVAEFDRAVCQTYPGADRLHYRARAALISLAYNRGLGLERDPDDPLDRRREMRELKVPILTRNYNGMADLLRSMKRIWEGEGMGGLLRRREHEAILCEQAGEP